MPPPLSCWVCHTPRRYVRGKRASGNNANMLSGGRPAADVQGFGYLTSESVTSVRSSVFPSPVFCVA